MKIVKLSKIESAILTAGSGGKLDIRPSNVPGDKVWILDEAHDAANEAAMTATAAVHGVTPVRDTLVEARDEIWNSAIEAAVQKTPGGSVCDPQQVADEIRTLLR